MADKNTEEDKVVDFLRGSQSIAGNRTAPPPKQDGIIRYRRCERCNLLRPAREVENGRCAYCRRI